MPGTSNHSITGISEEESVFDDATEGDTSHSLATDDDSDEGGASNCNDGSAILRPGRPPRRTAAQPALQVFSDESLADEDGDEEDSRSEPDTGSASGGDDEEEEGAVDENMSLASHEESEEEHDDGDAEEGDADASRQWCASV